MTTSEMRELDAWISENIFGARISKSGRGSVIATFGADTPEERDQIIDAKHPWDSNSWNPTTDPAAALEVLKKCADKVWLDNPTITKCQHFKIEIWNNGLWVVMQSEKADMFVEDETLELSICLFAKKLFTK